MFKKLFELFQALLFLARDVQENKEAITRLRHEFDELTELVSRTRFEIENLRDGEKHERERMILKLENALLKFERQLPSFRDGKRSK